MKSKRKSIYKVFALCIAALMMTMLMPTAAFAKEADGVTVYVTISEKGNLATAKDGSAMAWKKVIVKDVNKDKKYSYDEAMQAVHAAYNTADNYAVNLNDFVTKLWGHESKNFLFAINGNLIYNGEGAAAVKAGDHLMAATLQDEETDGDCIALFDKNKLTATAGRPVELHLIGNPGYTGGSSQAIANASVGIWKNGTVNRIGTTDDAGNVSLTFHKPGTYIVTANGVKPGVPVNGWQILRKVGYDAGGSVIYGKFNDSTQESFVGYTEKDYGQGPYPYKEIKYIPSADFEANEWTAEKGHLLYSELLLVEGKTTAPACIVTVKADSTLGKAKVATKASSWTTAKVYWSKVKGAKSYQVYRSVKKNSGYKKMAVTKARHYTGKKLKTGKIYYYKVKAVGKGGKSSMSAPKAIQAVAKAPTLKLTAGRYKIRVGWTKVPGSTGYKLYRAGSKDGKFKMIRDSKGDNNLKYNFVTKKSGKKYYFKVRAYKKVGKKTYYSAYSVVKMKAAK